MILPSSQPSEPFKLPSPQTGSQLKATVELDRLQLYPVSTLQLALHPSIDSVLLSSHTSLPTSRPSPQTGTQLDITPPSLQEYPDSTPQLELHPSPDSSFP